MDEKIKIKMNYYIYSIFNNLKRINFNFKIINDLLIC